MEILAAIGVVVGAVILVLLPFEATGLCKRAADERLSITKARALVIAFTSITLSFAAGITCFLLTMFGPAYLFNDFIGLPWLTAIPALILGFYVTGRTSKKFVAASFERLPPVQNPS